MLCVSVHDLLVDSVLTRRHHRALLCIMDISCLLVQAILLDHWQIRVFTSCRVRRNLLVRFNLVGLLKHVLSIFHHYILLVLVCELRA